jgi:hypothetical protein
LTPIVHQKLTRLPFWMSEVSCSSLRRAFQRETRHVRGVLLETARVRVDELSIDRAATDQLGAERVKQLQVALRAERVVMRRRHGRLGLARVDHYDAR